MGQFWKPKLMVMGPAGEKELPSLFRYFYLPTVFSILLF